MKQREARFQLALALGAVLLLGGCGGGGSTTASTPSPAAPPGSSAVVSLDTSNFETVVADGASVCLIDFFHPGCSHCRNMEPIIESLAADFEGRAVVGKVDVTASPDIARAWGVQAYPTFVVVKDGREFSRRLGEQTYDHLATIVRTALGS